MSYTVTEIEAGVKGRPAHPTRSFRAATLGTAQVVAQGWSDSNGLLVRVTNAAKLVVLEYPALDTRFSHAGAL